MFNSYYPFRKINHKASRTEGIHSCIEHVYSFRGRTNKRYIVVVEEYNYFVFIVKFFLQERKIHPDRYHRLTNLNECSRVLTTIGEIMKTIYDSNPYASFGFIGTNLPEEKKENTKRFRLYARVVSQVITPVYFEHREAPKHSAYLLINRVNQEEDLLNKIEKMFDAIYVLNQ